MVAWKTFFKLIKYQNRDFQAKLHSIQFLSIFPSYIHLAHAFIQMKHPKQFVIVRIQQQLPCAIFNTTCFLASNTAMNPLTQAFSFHLRMRKRSRNLNMSKTRNEVGGKAAWAWSSLCQELFLIIIIIILTHNSVPCTHTQRERDQSSIDTSSKKENKHTKMVEICILIKKERERGHASLEMVCRKSGRVSERGRERERVENSVAVRQAVCSSA